MENENQEVKQTEASGTSAEAVQEAVQTAGDSSQQQVQQTTSDVTALPALEGQKEELVPIHQVNEWRRKYDELTERLPSLIEEGFKKYGTQTQTREYTVAELEQFALQHPENRPWVEEQKASLLTKQLDKKLEERITADRTQMEAGVRKQNALKYVQDSYPDAFVRNQTGQILGWNNNHPLTQQISMLMQDKRLINDPDGLAIAADIANGRLSRSQQTVTQRQQQQLKQEVKSLQKQTFVEGGGKAAQVSTDPIRSALDRVKKTGSMKDAEAAIGAIFKRAKEKTNED